MLSEDDFSKPLPSSLGEEENPPESIDLGAFKTRNPDDDPYEREFVHISPESSPFKKTVQLLLSAHGWEDASKKQAMTLLVFGFSLHCNDPDHVYKSVRTWFKFKDHVPEGKKKATAKASPTVVAWAPFTKTERWDAVEAELRRQYSGEATIGAEQIAKVELKAGTEWEISHKRTYFARGTSDPIYNERAGKVYGVEFYLEHNELQNDGVKPDFKVAILLKRASGPDGAPIPFDATFEMRVQAGFGHDFVRATNRIFRSFFRPHTLADEPILFKPSNNGVKANGHDGVLLKQAITFSKEEAEELEGVEEGDIKPLGKYAVGDMLVGVTTVPGLETLEAPPH